MVIHIIKKIDGIYKYLQSILFRKMKYGHIKFLLLY
nr:MAG TPA: hypothetical protein [Bacteriophage sp.]